MRVGKDWGEIERGEIDLNALVCISYPMKFVSLDYVNFKNISQIFGSVSSTFRTLNGSYVRTDPCAKYVFPVPRALLRMTCFLRYCRL